MPRQFRVDRKYIKKWFRFNLKGFGCQRQWASVREVTVKLLLKWNVQQWCKQCFCAFCMYWLTALGLLWHLVAFPCLCKVSTCDLFFYNKKLQMANYTWLWRQWDLHFSVTKSFSERVWVCVSVCECVCVCVCVCELVSENRLQRRAGVHYRLSIPPNGAF